MNPLSEAVIRLRVRGPGSSVLVVDAVVDSSSNESLTLPAATIGGLGLVRQSGGRAVLADGSVRQFDIYAAEVAWDGAWRPVLVTGVGSEALLGMRLLAGHELRIAVIPVGSAEITPLP